MWISKRPPVCSGGTRFGYSTVAITSVQKGFTKVFEPTDKAKVIHTLTTLWSLAKPLESYPGIIATSTPHRSETNGVAERAGRRIKDETDGIVERAVRRIEEGTSAVLLQSGLAEKWQADSVECCCYLRKSSRLLIERKIFTNGDLENHSVGRNSFRIDDWVSSGHPMDPGVSVQNKNFTGNPEKLAKVPGTREETKSHLHWQFLRIRISLWRSLLESLHVYTTPIGWLMRLLREQCAE